MTVKVVTVVGARPQFVKAGVVSTAFDTVGGVEEVLVHTGQHFDDNMSEIFFRELGLRSPAINLGISGGTHAEMTAQMMVGLERFFLSESPDIVLVYGDTNSTLAASLAAAKIHLPVAHVEAGLRSFNNHMPEEINRILTDRVSHWLFTPTETACRNLKNEGFDEKNILFVGDVMYDVAKLFLAKSYESRVLRQLNITEKNYALVTVHRAENTDDADRLRGIATALSNFSESIPIVWPMHPRTRNIVEKEGLFPIINRAIKICAPLGYLDMVAAEKNAALIITDSGGVQKEAFFYRVPCVTVRDQTEWVELIEAGWNRLAPAADVMGMLEAFNAALGSTGIVKDLYGDGTAAHKIVCELIK